MIMNMHFHRAFLYIIDISSNLAWSDKTLLKKIYFPYHGDLEIQGQDKELSSEGWFPDYQVTDFTLSYLEF